MKFQLIFALLAATFLQSDAILNGRWWFDAPYAAHIIYQVTVGGFGGQGGGVIISNRHVLTAAFIVQPGFQHLEVRIGGSSRSMQLPVAVQSRAGHPQFTPNPRTNDIAILLLQLPLVFDRSVRPIQMLGVNAGGPYEHEQITVLGFGGFPGNTNRDLEAAFLRVTSNARCATTNNNQISVLQQFCAEDDRMRSDFCVNDIGGAAVALIRGEEVLVGIASVQRCDAAAGVVLPSLFSRISAYRQWVDQTMATLV